MSISRTRAATSTHLASCCTRCWPADRRSPAPTSRRSSRRSSRPRSPRSSASASGPTHVDAAVARALEKLPADRWQTAAEFAEALAGTADPGSGSWVGVSDRLPPGPVLGCAARSPAGSAGSVARSPSRPYGRPDPVQRRARSGRRAHLHADRPPQPRRPAVLRDGHGRPAGRGAAPAVRSARAWT